MRHSLFGFLYSAYFIPYSLSCFFILLFSSCFLHPAFFILLSPFAERILIRKLHLRGRTLPTPHLAPKVPDLQGRSFGAGRPPRRT